MNETPQNHAKNGEKKYWLDDSRNVDKIVYTLYSVCGLLILADFLYQKHPHFDMESLFGFYGFFGFIGSVFLVLTAKLMRKILMRDEDYYGDEEPIPGGDDDA